MSPSYSESWLRGQYCGVVDKDTHTSIPYGKQAVPPLVQLAASSLEAAMENDPDTWALATHVGEPGSGS